MDPFRIFRTWEIGEGRFFHFQRLKGRKKLGERLLRKPGADAASIFQFARVVVIADEQRSQAVARAAGIGEAADDKLGPLPAFDLEPIVAAPADVRPVAAFGNDSFQTLPLGGMEERVAVATHVFRVAQRSSIGRKFQVRELGFALLKRQVARIEAVQKQEIKHHVYDAALLAGTKAILQKLKIADPFVVERHDLTVENRAPQPKLGNRLRQFRESGGPIQIVASFPADIRAVDERQHPVTVEFDFVDPLVSHGRSFHERGQLDLHVLGQRCADVTARFFVPPRAAF